MRQKIFCLLLPFLLIGIGLYFLMRPNIGDNAQKQRLTPLLFTLFVAPFIGFYDGMFGAGTGSFFMLAFVFFAGFDLVKATAYTKLLNL